MGILVYRYTETAYYSATAQVTAQVKVHPNLSPNP